MKIGSTIIEDPNICPHCHVVNEPEFNNSYSTRDSDEIPQIITIWRCTNKDCRRYFPALFNLDGDLVRFLNGLPKGPDWPKPIADLNSGNNVDKDNENQTRFIQTYLQSLTAENDGLDEIAGMGFRKSIEYLVKDWAIQSNPDDAEKINKMWLGSVIETYYDGDLKGILERATWLGNDQTHYNRLFEEFDINDLKELIGLIMVELDRQYKMKHYIDTIEKRKH